MGLFARLTHAAPFVVQFRHTKLRYSRAHEPSGTPPLYAIFITGSFGASL
jgi:hypothetical protein